MSEVRGTIRGECRVRGGILGYPLDWVYQEVAVLSMRVHWTHDDVLNLDHAERRRWIEEILKVEHMTGSGNA